MSEENKKTNFFKEAFKSIKDLDKYEDFALEMPKKAFKYFIKMVAVFCIIVSIFYTYKIVENINDIYATIKDRLPDFSYQKGILNLDTDEPVILENYQDYVGKVVIDTNANEDKVKKYEEDKDFGLLLLNDRLSI